MGTGRKFVTSQYYVSDEHTSQCSAQFTTTSGRLLRQEASLPESFSKANGFIMFHGLTYVLSAFKFGGFVKVGWANYKENVQEVPMTFVQSWHILDFGQMKELSKPSLKFFTSRKRIEIIPVFTVSHAFRVSASVTCFYIRNWTTESISPSSGWGISGHSFLSKSSVCLPFQ